MRATVTVPSHVEFVRPATAFLVQAARALQVAAAADPVFEVAVSEAIANAVKHGGTHDEEATITCEVEVHEGTLTVRIIDEGSGFVMRETPLPELSRERIEALPASGYGLPIIHTVFPTVRVVAKDGRFAVELVVPAERVSNQT